MFRIGVFARIGQVSVRTLRFYSEKGLLQPARIDPQSGYRYYGAEQIPTLLHILALRDLGFSLDEIAEAPGPLPAEKLAPLLEQKRRDVRERLDRDTSTLARIDARLLELRKERTETMNPTYDITTKSVPPVLAAALRETIPNWEQVTPTFNRMFDELYGYLAANQASFAGPAFDLWTDEERKDADMSVIACAPLAHPIIETDRIQMLTLPAVEMVASTIHHGPFAEAIGKAHLAVVEWIGQNGYRISGPSREIYHTYERDGDPALWVTEIQYPVEKA